jgi:hypothetical protein
MSNNKAASCAVSMVEMLRKILDVLGDCAGIAAPDSAAQRSAQEYRKNGNEQSRF